MRGKPDLGVEARALPVLVALSRGALTTGEVTHAVQIAGSSTRKFLLALQDAGFIIQRWDKKWVIVVRLAAVKVPGTAGEVVYEPRQDEQAPVGGQRAVPGAQTPSAPPARLPDGILAPQVYKALPPKVSKIQVSTSAKLASEKLKIPSWVRHRGEVSLSKQLGACEGCKRPTPIRYGSHAICPVCARKTVEG